MMRLWAIADIHVSFKSNREEFAKIESKGENDGLILAGDGAPPRSCSATAHADHPSQWERLWPS